jgi:transposase InsO family protein
VNKYLQYVRAVSNGNKEEQRVILNGLLNTFIKSNSLGRDHDSDFEAEVCDEWVKRVSSVIRKGNSYDNALMESFYRTINRGLIQDDNSKRLRKLAKNL